MKLMRRILIFIFYVFFVCAVPDVQLIRDTCRRRCESNLIYSGRSNGLFCDKDCSVNQCHSGCNLFPDVLSSTCTHECSTNIQQKINTTGLGQAGAQDEMKNCNQGCVFALDEYTDFITDSLLPLAQPTLIRDSKNFSSVVLQWEKNVDPNVTLHIHKKIVDSAHSSDWQLHEVFKYNPALGTLYIKQLFPYVTYQFKVLAAVTPLQRHVFESPATVNITTLSHGVPSSKPIITRLSAPSPTVVSLSWQPPAFPNGPLLGYRINLDPVGHVQLKVTTLEVAGNVTSWTFSQCQSSQLYRFSLSAWNAIGEGPPDTGNITTPNPVSASETPFLLMGSDNKLIKINTLDVLKVDDHVHTDKQGVTIKGIGIHIRRQLIFLSTSERQVKSISLRGDTTRSNLFESIIQPSAIAVDWLTDRVYIACAYSNRLYSCPLDRDLCFTAVDNLPSPPTDVKVDPVNGYLYYSLAGGEKGLYRVDLETMERNSSPNTKHIVTLDDLATFVVDFDNVRLYFINNSLDTVMSTFLDGSDLKDVRPKVKKRAYAGATTMAYCNQVFFWTDGRKPWFEEYDKGFSQYSHNNLLVFDAPFTSFNLFQPRAQPTPVPLTPPSQVEALFTPDRTEIRWQPPQRLQYQGKGAWCNWMYEVELKDQLPDGRFGRNIQMAETANLTHTVYGLMPNTSYSVRVRAKSQAGVGPWSQHFIGVTMQQELIPVRVLMGVPGLIMEKDLSNLTQTTVVNFFKNSVDISWHKDLLMWTTTGGEVVVYNRVNGSKHFVQAAKSAYCVAYDWLAGKIFWSEPKLGVIKRSEIRGIQPEFIYQAEARDITIDSLAGRLYWATTNSIDSAYLNGEDHVEIFSVPFFSGRHVISLTLNYDLGKVMWYVKGYDSQELWMADLVGRRAVGTLDVLETVRHAGNFDSISLTSGLQYFSHKLFWIDNTNSLVVGDMECNYTSAVAPEYKNITSFAVTHPSMQLNPDGINEDDVVVIPSKIEKTSIRTVGSWDNFNLTWSSDTGVNHGAVFYKLFLQIGREQIRLTTSHPWHTISHRSPYTQMVVSLQPYTYWGYAEAETLSIRSPMSKPQEPLTPRVYVTQHKNASTSQTSLAADFRWSTPHVTNGILSHHLVTYWQEGQDHEKEVVEVSGTARHFILTSLVTSQIYFFQVVACTEAGCGPASSTVSAVTDAVNPVPMLLIATSTGVSISEFDSDLNTTTLLDQISPSALAYLAQDNRTFWIERNAHALFVSQNSDQKVELVEVDGKGVDLSLDWISRTLYMVTETSPAASSIMGYHMEQALLTQIISSFNKTIGCVISDPYASMLLWTEMDNNGQGTLLSAPIGSTQTSIVLGTRENVNHRNKRSKFPTCSCSDDINVSPVVAMDYTKQGRNELVFVEVTTNTIYSADINGCNCTVIYRPTASQDHGLPPSLLTVDQLRVYWYNTTQSLLYSVDKNTGSNLQHQHLADVKDLVAYGPHLQPLPDSDCLDPGAYGGNVSIVFVGNTTVSLQLDPVVRPERCGRISVPQDKFTVYYKKVASTRDGFIDCSTSTDDCMKTEAYSTEVEVKNLEPYTEYLVQVAVSNYYTEYLSEALSSSIKFTTRPGMPDAARDVIAIPLTPEEMRVRWLPPHVTNGPERNLTYFLHCSTTGRDGQVIRQMINVTLSDRADSNPEMNLKKLEPGNHYDISVETCMMGRSLCNMSSVVQNRTFSAPGDIVFKNATHNSIIIRWTSPSDNSISRHNYESAKFDARLVDTLEWQAREMFPIITQNNTVYTESFNSLDPHTSYTFRVMLIYRNPPFRAYLWPSDPRRFIFQTLAWTPEQPPPPVAQALQQTAAYEVVWGQPYDNGEPITNYSLQICGTSSAQWQIAYTGAERRWLVDESLTKPNEGYVFRVAAENIQGWSNFSSNSSIFRAPPAVQDSSVERNMQVGVAVALCAVAVIFIVLIIFIILWKRKEQEKRKKQQFMAMVVRGPDSELAILRELPHSTFQQSNTLYGLTIIPTAEEVASLPHVCRDQLDLTQFLGSGAFGEVYEGVAHDIRGAAPGPIKCAVKTLRKSASETEKEEFVKEAILMKNFQHEHIMGLLGVCLNNDPHFIILELMEGGDLLSFLRSSRASTNSPAKLLLPDLVKISVHVARGCKYLEDMHFVHRDLAARNCLVSSTDPRSMVVKIGDFGLARDIYKHDYYRKEGEGLLPVRWMSPESLVDGVFTTQSDIWAFGVLMWEVVTLGQQPYPARTNIEVLHFVRSGGKLERPDRCTDDVFNLMQKCWSFTSEERPCFAYLLQELETYEEKCSQMSPADIALHSPTGADGARVCSTYKPRQYVTSSSDGSTRSSNSSIASATQAQVYRGPSPTPCQPHRRGGSMRMTPSSKKRRMKDLLGSGEDKEKLMVDLSGMGRSRTSSLDSKRSSVSDTSRAPYSSRCPTVREYDSMGYLSPRSQQMPQYLQLLNHAPELELPAFKNARGVNHAVPEARNGSSLSQSGSAFHPVGPCSRTPLSSLGMPQSVVYTQVTCPLDQPGSNSPSRAGSDSMDPRQRRSSSSSYQPPYGVVSVQDPRCCGEEVEQRLVVDLTDLNRIKAAQRKFSDQDLYSNPAQFQQRGYGRMSTSSSVSDHPYFRVATDSFFNNNNNGYNCASNNSARATPVHLPRERLHSGQDPLNQSYNSSRGGVDFLNQSYCSSPGYGQDPVNQSYTSARSKAPPLVWNNRSASESDSVFEHEEDVTEGPPPPYINMANSARSWGRVFPDSSGPLARFDIAQASLL